MPRAGSISMRVIGLASRLIPGASYRVAVNSFLVSGGDNFTALPNGANRLGGAQDLDALESYFRINLPLAPPGAQNHIIIIPL